MTAATFLLGMSAFATEKKAEKKWARNYGMAGCGLGSMIMGKRSGQLSAATTESASCNIPQLGGITSGTSNCEDGPNNEVAHRIDGFVVANKVALAGDMARGGGETLASLSNLMGCSGEQRYLGSVMQSNFGDVFPNHQVAPNEITDSIITVIRQDDRLAETCKNII